ncbi:MAG: M48 family metallopeptidase [Candidatus Omnitrophica bacterium]|nr:M48 family metallopeptidase [Candidatus Omnitrophota bacterium]
MEQEAAMQDKAKQYSSIKHRIGLLNIVLPPLLLFILLITGTPAYFKNMSELISSNDYINLMAFYAFISVFYYAINLPLEFYSGYLLEHRFSLSNQTLKGWIAREVKKNIIAFIISSPLVAALYIFLKIWPLNWWLWTALLWFSVSIILAKFTPVIIVPLFYKYSPLKDAALENKMNQLVSKVGFKAGGVYELNISKDTKKANAALLGLGKQKRIVLCDTLISNFSHEEIEAVMAHELGHHKLNHMWKLILTGGIFTFIMFFFTNIVFLKLHNFFGYSAFHDYESLVLIYFIVASFNALFGPAANAFSRRLEKEADLFSLTITGNVSAFISTMKKLGEQNLADVNPGRIYEIMLYNHPPIARRITLAESFKNSSQNSAE